MNSSLKPGLILGTVVLMAGSLSGESGKGTAAAQTLSIRLYDHAEAPSAIVHSGTEEAGWLFRSARIRICWEFPSTESPEDRGTDMTSAAIQQPETRAYIVVRLIRKTPATVAPGALGYALPLSHTGAHVLIFYDRVETLAHTVNEETDVVLGCAIAHEIGHILLGSSEHASAGLMQARWTAATWRLASAGLLAFRLEERASLSVGVQRFQARPMLPTEQPELASSSLRHSPE